MDLTSTIAPKSDQKNADDFLAGAQTFTITADVEYASPEQPFGLVLDGDTAHPYKPGKSMRRVLVAAWGPESSAYIGRRLTLYTDPSIKFGGQELGGIRISHMSHIDRTLKLALTETKGKKKAFVVAPLPDAAPARVETLEERVTKMVNAFGSLDVTEGQIAARTGTPRAEWTADDLASLLVVYQSMRNGESTAADHFPA